MGAKSPQSLRLPPAARGDNTRPPLPRRRRSGALQGHQACAACLLSPSGPSRQGWLSRGRERARVAGHMPEPRAPTAPADRHEPRALALWAVAAAVLTWGCSNVMIKLVSTSGLV